MLEYLTIIRCIFKTLVDHCSLILLGEVTLSSKFPHRFWQLINELVPAEVLLFQVETMSCRD